MLPVNTVFPEFVPDQLLTSDDLNELFGYLDEQGRMTRTNLIGIGIVCGLEVKTNAANTEITITKGVGVTSEGYLVSVPSITYTEFNSFDAVKEKYYDRFVDVATKTQKFNLWELKQAGVDPDATDLSAAFLADKVVLLFVELLAENNKNCDPESCDDKGIHITITFRPLLVTKADAKAFNLIGGTGGAVMLDTFTGLPEIKMRRFDVPNTNPVTSADIFNAYKTVLSNSFMLSTENALGQAYTRFSAFISDEYPADPFQGLAAEFAFINDGTITTSQLQHIQYIYDLFSDFLLAYEEFRKAGSRILRICNPDSSLFPRHLLLGEAIPLPAGVKSNYRHYFIYSPLFDHKNLVTELKILFKKLVLLAEKFFVPPVNVGPPTTAIDPYIRITPSSLGDVPLSVKAIPYYYHVTSGPSPLYQYWNYQKTLAGIPQRNLSYRANQYNAADDFVLNPLRYDLEPYNFLRIEGIIGKSYVSVLRNIKRQILQYRLPFDVIALTTDNANVFRDINFSRLNSISFNNSLAGRDMMDMLCHFQDLEALYDTLKNEILCNLCKELKYYYDLPFNFSASKVPAAAAGQASIVGLFNYCSPGYTIKPRTFGLVVEEVYKITGDDGAVTIQVIAEVLGIETFLPPDNDGDGNPDDLSASATAFIGYIVTLFEIPIYIIRLANTLTAGLSSLDVEEYCRIHKLLSEKASSLRFAFNIFTAGQRTATTGAAGTTVNRNVEGLTMFNAAALSQSNTGAILLWLFMLEDFFDHLDVLIYNCKCSALKALRTEYLKRVAYLTRLRQFGYFTQHHPGIQHKAGVPMGGTFIIVYHSRTDDNTGGRITGRFILTGRVLDVSGAVLPGAVVSVQGTTIGTVTDATGRFRLIVSELPVVLVARFTGIGERELIITTEAPVDIVIGANADDTGEDVINEISPGSVIADFYLPYRCCSDCPPIQYIIQEIAEPEPPNEGPVADAGRDQEITLPTNSVTLHGEGSTDPDGSIDKYEWIKKSGPGNPDIKIPGSSQTSVTGLEEGTYEFELTVTDNSGNTAKDSTKVVVHTAPPVNEPPVANAGEDGIFILSATNNILTLTGTGTDPEGAISSFVWTLKSGPNTPSILAPGQEQTQVINLAPGPYIFTFTVTDNQGATGSDDVEITVVLPENQPPVANAGLDLIVNLPVNSVTLNGSASNDPDGAIVSYAWKFEDGPNTPTIGSPNNKITSVGGLTAGVYKFSLVVKDDRGATATDEVLVTVNKAAEKSCQPLGDIIDLFNKLPDTYPDLFPAFTKIFQQYPQVESYFKQMQEAGIKDRQVAEQIDFFATPVGGQTITQLLQAWLRLLNTIIINNNDVRLPALDLYRILVQLAMYIVCIQQEDFDKAKIPMVSVFKLINAHVENWVVLDKEKPFSDQEREIIRNINNDIKAEITRIMANGENSTKPKYLEQLQAIVRILDSIT